MKTNVNITPIPSKVLVIVPAYNEAEGIECVIAQIRAEIPYADVLVVNDGSKDDTGSRAEKAGALVANLSCNLGIGGAVQTGYRYAEAGGYDYAVQIDGDGQHNPSDLRLLLEAMQESGADMVVGSRFIEKAGYQSTFARKIGIELLARLVTRLTGKRITDPTSGYRLCNRRAIALFAREYPTDYPEVEALMLLDRYRGTFKEVPVVMNARHSGVSSISAFKSAYYMCKVILAVLIMKTKKKEEMNIGYGI
ncbi:MULTISPECIES: glycosyltransferase family 2 protein [unclassified Paenibacillus]|uniref:glycosyltransferase family 2 protein n=1 Tax=unclassified Paenibacillus TaxID=185978 RepID=UPI001C1112A8|nr:MULTISPECIES: glycosyltransferase family 2 protein [unclassified Paenibacillus]MBU5441140.1 glycosyltransferase family 2 protein [Paenibacillus sp. MSJ-34]CAH0120536.1 Undecaprenyl-phosphate mannosyltransferase [Paenibacillus sp. CECT 9249]